MPSLRTPLRTNRPPILSPLVPAVLAAAFGFGFFLLFLQGTVGLVDASGHVVGRDLINLYVAGTLIGEGKVAVLFDSEGYLAELRRIVGDPDYPKHYWSYPPLALPLAQLVAQVPYPVALFGWYAAGAAAILAAAWLVRLPLGWGILTALSPAAILSMLSGQNGPFVAALMVAAVVWGAGGRIHRAGLAWAALAAKPHLGVAVLPMLLAQRRFGVIATGALYLALAVGLTALAYGGEMWTRFLTATSAQQRHVLEVWDGILLYIMPTLFVQGRLWELGLGAAYALHAAGALATVVLLVRAAPAARDDVRGWLTWLTLGTFLLLPYSFLYDLVVLQLVLALWQREPGRLFALREGFVARLLWAVAWLVPVLAIPSAAYLSIQPVPFLLLFLLWRRAVARQRATAPAD